MKDLQFIEGLLIAGFSPMPVKEDKRPTGSWKQFQQKALSLDDVDAVFRGAWGVAVVCGKVSGVLECIDFDAHNKNIEQIFNSWRSDSGVAYILQRNQVYIERSPRGGFHVMYRYDADKPDGNLKLANWSTGESMIETRGEGGYVIVSPSPGYEVVQGDLDAIGAMTWDEREYLISHCRNFTQAENKQTAQEPEQRKAVKSDPISYFNYEKSGYAKQLLKEKGWTLVTTDKDGTEHWRRPGKEDGTSATWGKRYNSLFVFSSSVKEFEQEVYYTPFEILTRLRFGGEYRAAVQWIEEKYFQQEAQIPYIRVGTDYYKKIYKTDRYGIKALELKAWKKDEIKQDHGKAIFDIIPKYDDFAIVPDNFEFMPVVGNCYNLYSEFAHRPQPGEWLWSRRLIEHVFGEQYKLGLRYLQALYLHPKRMLPILVLVSKERQTGKTTFINWLNMVFQKNMVNINPEDLASSFNSSYATKNIIAIEETLIEKSVTVEKLKALATGKHLTVNQKFVNGYSLPFFGKIILASNNEDRFAKIDEEETRFFIRKLTAPKFTNHDIESNLMEEIPAFLHYLTQLPPINWSVDRSGFTAAELMNDSLAEVKKESKSGLYKELYHLFSEFFSNHPDGEAVIMATPTDIKEKWFKNNGRIDINYIARVLKHEYHLEPSEKSVRYLPFGIQSYQYNTPVGKKTGAPYTLTAEMFGVDPTIVSDEVIIKRSIVNDLPF